MNVNGLLELVRHDPDARAVVVFVLWLLATGLVAKMKFKNLLDFVVWHALYVVLTLECLYLIKPSVFYQLWGLFQ